MQSPVADDLIHLAFFNEACEKIQWIGCGELPGWEQMEIEEEWFPQRA